MLYKKLLKNENKNIDNRVFWLYWISSRKKGYKKALTEDKNFLAGLNVYKGQVTYKSVADTFGYEYSDPSKII